MKDKIAPELYSGHEQELTWVPRYSEKRDKNGKLIKSETPLWRYFVSRHRARWIDTKPTRRLPSYFSAENGGIGWWFPKIWAEGFNPAVFAFPRSSPQRDEPPPPSYEDAP